MAALLPPILLSPASLPAHPAPIRGSLRPSAEHHRLPVQPSVGPWVSVPARSGVPLVLAAVLVGVALLVAPERPQDQEAICQRHSGEVACRVW